MKITATAQLICVCGLLSAACFGATSGQAGTDRFSYQRDAAAIPTAAPVSSREPGQALQYDPCSYSDSIARNNCIDSLRAELAYDGFVWKDRIASFRDQLVVTNIAFGLVLVIVLVGLYLTLVQFRMAMGFQKVLPPGAASREAEEGSNADFTSYIDIGHLVVKSSVLGVIILVLALAFFGLYMKFAYKITEVSSAARPVHLRTNVSATPETNQHLWPLREATPVSTGMFVTAASSNIAG